MFLDREPYIRLWRPFYQLFGPSIRRTKALFSDSKADHLQRIEQRLAALEAANQQACSALEQCLFSVVQDRQINEAVDLLQKAIADGFASQTAEISANNAAQWAALETLLVAVMGNSTRSAEVDIVYGSNGKAGVPLSRKAVV